MKEEIKFVLKKTLLSGTINGETADKIREDIFQELQMSNSNATDRKNWSNWISGHCPPNRFARIAINKVLANYQIPPIYD